VFTIYVGGTGSAMIHELDMQDGKAWCVDLPGSGEYNSAGSYALALSRDGKHLYAAGGAYGSVVAVAGRQDAHVRERGRRMGGRPRRRRTVRTLHLPADAVVAYGPSGRLWLARYGSGLSPAPA